MFNLGAPEVLVIMVLALIVLGPNRLPDAARQVGKAMSEIRKMSNGFQKEMKAAFDDTAETAARAKGTESVLDAGAAAAAIEPAPIETPAAEPLLAQPPVRAARAQPLVAKKAATKKAAPAKKAAPRKKAT